MSDSKSILQTRLEQKLADSGMSVHALEKQAGLKRSAVQNILHGRSKRPSADILAAVCKILGGSVRDLLGEPHNEKLPHSMESIKTTHAVETSPLNFSLYIKAIKAAEKTFKAKNIQSREQETLKFVHEIYHYARSADKTEIDAQFSEWLAHKMFSKNS